MSLTPPSISRGTTNSPQSVPNGVRSVDLYSMIALDHHFFCLALQLMTSYQEKAPEAAASDWWTYMEEVFDLQSQHETFVGPFNS